MIAFHYPPIAASAGALRSRAFVSYLPRNGWHAHVLAPKVSIYTETERHAFMPDAGEIHRCWGLDTRRDLGWNGRYLGLAAIPDRWISWAPAAIATGLRIIRRHPIEAIWSTYPIATSHLIASILAHRTNLPWIAEFRDPVERYSPGSTLQNTAQRCIERRVVRYATRTVFVTRGALADSRRRYPESADRLALIPNGYDPSLEPMQSRPSFQNRGGPLRLLHTGQLYRDGRNPTALFDALFRLRERGLVDASRLQIIFRNSQEEAFYQQQIDQWGVGDLVSLAPCVDHRQALSEQREADGLLLLQGRRFNHQIPAKLFEYLRAHRPVLALIDRGGDTAALLDELEAGIQAAIDDPESIAAALQTFLARERHGSGRESESWVVDNHKLARYSRENQTVELARLLNDVTAHRS